MTDNAADLFGLNLERETDTVELPLGLVTPNRVAPDELEIYEAVFRLQGHAVVHMIIFDDVAEDGGEIFGNAAQWGAALGYPPSRPPTMSECYGWLNYYQAKLEAETYYTLEDYRAKRAAAPAPKQPASPKASPVAVGPRQGPKA